MQILTLHSPEIRGILFDLERIEARLLAFVREASQPDCYTPATLRDVLHIGLGSMYNFMERGHITPFRFRGKKYFSRREVEALCERNYFPAYSRGRWVQDCEESGAAAVPDWMPGRVVEELEWVEGRLNGLVL